MEICPCKDCPKQGCGAYHVECKEYLEWSERREAERERIHEEKKYAYPVWHSKETYIGIKTKIRL